ncbi:MAG: zinc-binding dehydrogenase [Aquificaceae bacterium]|nr:zinc-binding dehydrogenase [Aquificaceae bacterium]MDW8237715.1 zinc-binding dehydrogenase [Aquificaceae bacterium]
MKGVLLECFGGVDCLRFYDNLKEPKLKEGEVLVEIKSIGLNRVDIWVRKGVLSYKPKLPLLVCSDASGVVIDADSSVRHLVGKKVVVLPGVSCGSCQSCKEGNDHLCSDYKLLGFKQSGVSAQVISLPYRNIVEIPDSMDFKEASCIALAGITAYSALFLKGGLKLGQSVLIWAGASGVGSFAIQLAKLSGANVVASAGSDEKLELCKSLGANEVFNHYKQDPAEILSKFGGFDLVIDSVGGQTLQKSLSYVKPGGKVVFFGTTLGSSIELNIREVFSKNVSLMGLYMGPSWVVFELIKLYLEGKLKPVIGEVLSLREIARAHELLEEFKVAGKVVLDVGSW